jgi:hypothetical protein
MIWESRHHFKVLALCIALFVAMPALAAQPYLEQRVEDLEKEMQTLRERLDRLERGAATAPGTDKLRAVAPAKEDVTPPPQAATAPRWNKIKRGMTQIQVEQLVGKPTSRNGEGYGERWSFGDSAYVEFDAAGEVTGWQAPR